MNILFIGNSYTYCNALPVMVHSLSLEAHDADPLQCAMSVAGGVTLEWHWQHPNTHELLAARSWDYVVLQEQSLRPLDEPDAFYRYGRLLHEEITRLGARTIYYLTWARRATPERQEKLTATYRALARHCSAPVAPVGEVWRVVRQEQPETELYADDGSHPNPLGSYLAACTLYAVLTGHPPAGLPGRLLGADEVEILVDLPAEDATYYQRIVQRVVDDERQ